MMGLFKENLIIALGAVFANKTRALLTTLGIVIGILSVTLMGTLISGLDRSFEKSMSFLGRDVLFISKHAWFSNDNWWDVRNRPDIRLNYADKIMEQSKYVETVAPTLRRRVDAIRGDESVTGMALIGTTPEYVRTSTTDIKSGRFITEGEHRSGSRVVVIGNNIAENLFKNIDPIDEYIKIGPYKFRVIGVIEKQGKFLGLFSMDNQAIIPAGTYLRLFSRRGWVELQVKVDGKHISEAKDELTGIMRRIRGLRPGEKDNFAINQQAAFESQYKAIKFAIGGTGLFITVLSLVVGGIGIMNIMLVSVTERTREIGIRMAVGARSQDILRQFLVEAIVLSCLGGTIGFGLGIAASTGATMLINSFTIGTKWPIVVSLPAAVAAILFSATVGIFFGYYPARRASRLDPIEALRYE